MPPVSKSRPAGEPVPERTLKPLRLRALTGAAARRPLLPAPAAGPAGHLRHHVARSVQS